MQLLARYCGEERQVPPECRRCGGTHFHRHGFYERWILWVLGCSPERLKVNRFLCIGCLTTTSVLPWGILTYRLLSLALVMEHLWDEEQERCRDLLSSYRRRWYQWYPQLRRDMGLLFGRLPRDACEGWQYLAFEEMNPKLVDQAGELFLAGRNPARATRCHRGLARPRLGSARLFTRHERDAALQPAQRAGSGASVA